MLSAGHTPGPFLIKRARPVEYRVCVPFPLCLSVRRSVCLRERSASCVISLAYLHPQARRQLGCRSWKPPTYRQIGLIRDTLPWILRFPSGIFSREAAARPRTRPAFVCENRDLSGISARGIFLATNSLLSLCSYRDSYIRIICVYVSRLYYFAPRIRVHVLRRSRGGGVMQRGNKNAKLTSQPGRGNGLPRFGK